MADLQTTAGTLLAIAPESPADDTDAAQFAALSTWQNVGRISNMGEFGASASEVNFNDVSRRVTQKLKGVVDMGNQTIEIGRDIADLGQLIIEAANDLDGSTFDTIHSIRITYKSGTIEYYTGLVMNHMTTLGDADQVIGANTLFAITSAKVRA